MAAWLADNSFSWSKLKKSITAVWKCNASTLEPHSATMRHQAKVGGGREERGGGRLRRATSDWLGCRVYHVNLLQATEPERAHALEWSRKSSLAASTSLSLLHSAPSSYSSSHLPSSLSASHKHTQCTHMVRMLLPRISQGKNNGCLLHVACSSMLANWLNAKKHPFAGFGSPFEPRLRSSFIWFMWQTLSSRDFQKTPEEHLCSPWWTFWTSHFSAATLRTTWTWAATARGWETPHRPTCYFTEGQTCLQPATRGSFPSASPFMMTVLGEFL